MSKPIEGPFARLQRLTPSERRLLLPGFLALVLIGALVQTLGYGRTRRLLARTTSPAATAAAGRADAEALARIIAGIARHGPYRARCLTRSLTLWWFLSRRGIPSALRFGVMRAGEGILAHCWVEVEGVPLGDDRLVAGCYRAFPAVSAGPGGEQRPRLPDGIGSQARSAVSGASDPPPP